MALAALLREADTLEADLQHFYGVDLADYWRGELSLRRLSVLVRNLPTDSATSRKAVGNDWDLHALLIADVYQALVGSPHPSRPQPKNADRYTKLRRALEQQRERERAREAANT